MATQIKIPNTPFELFVYDTGCYLDINLENLIDYYDYHDAPTRVIFGMNIEIAQSIIEKLEQYIQIAKGDK